MNDHNSIPLLAWALESLSPKSQSNPIQSEVTEKKNIRSYPKNAEACESADILVIAEGE